MVSVLSVSYTHLDVYKRQVITRDEEEEGEAPTAVHTVDSDMAVDAFTNSTKWAEENGMSACEILMLKKL